MENSVEDLEYAVTLYNQNNKDQTLRDFFSTMTERTIFLGISICMTTK